MWSPSDADDPSGSGAGTDSPLVTLLELGVGGCLDSLLNISSKVFAEILMMRDDINGDSVGPKNIKSDNIHLRSVPGDPHAAVVVTALLAPTGVQNVGHLPFDALVVKKLVPEHNLIGQDVSHCGSGLIAAALEEPGLKSVQLTSSLALTMDIFTIAQIDFSGEYLGTDELSVITSVLLRMPAVESLCIDSTGDMHDQKTYTLCAGKEKVDLSSKNLGPADIHMIAVLVAHECPLMNSMRSLNILGNNECGDISILVQAVKQTPSIQSIAGVVAGQLKMDLASVPGGLGPFDAKILAADIGLGRLLCGIRDFDISHNECGCDDFKILCEALAKTSIERLNFSSMRLHSTDVSTITSMLESHTIQATTRTMDLSENPFLLSAGGSISAKKMKNNFISLCKQIKISSIENLNLANVGMDAATAAVLAGMLKPEELTSAILHQMTDVHQIRAAEFSGDSSLLLLGSGDKSATIICTESGAVLHHVKGLHYSEIVAVDFSPDADLVCLGSLDKTASLVDVSTGAELRKVECSASVNSVHFCPAGTDVGMLCLGLSDGVVMVVDGTIADLKKRKPDRVFDRVFTRDVTSVRWSADGRVLCIGSVDKTASIIDPVTGKILKKKIMAAGPVNAISWSADGKWLCLGSDTTSIYNADLQTGPAFNDLATHVEGAFQPVFLLDSLHTLPITSVAFSPDSKSLLVGSMDKR